MTGVRVKGQGESHGCYGSKCSGPCVAACPKGNVKRNNGIAYTVSADTCEKCYNENGQHCAAGIVCAPAKSVADLSSTHQLDHSERHKSAFIKA